MSYVMSPVQTALPDDNGYIAFANLQTGSNGDSNGVPTTLIGDAYGVENWGYQLWDGSLNGGFDTSNVPVTFDTGSSGNEVLTVNNTDPLSYQTDSLGPISSVVIEAAVQTNASAMWSNITVEFLQGGAVVEVDTISAGPQVNTINSGSANTAEQTLTITPTMPNADEVIITGTMRMHSPGIGYPASDAMLCNIFIYGANATSGGSGGGIGIGPGGPDNPNG